MDSARQAELELKRARARLKRCICCLGFHALTECLQFQWKTHIERVEFCDDNRLCRICFNHQATVECPEQNLWTCGAKGCNSLRHHKLLHCPHRGRLPPELTSVCQREEPVIHKDYDGKPVVGLTELGAELWRGETSSAEGETAPGRREEEEIAPEDRTPTQEREHRIKAVEKALERFDDMRRSEDLQLGVARPGTMPRAFEALCRLCKYPRHELGNCNVFLSLSVRERETTSLDIGCGTCLSVEHTKTGCPHSRRECGIYGCRLYHHPLLHRVAYMEPLSPEDDVGLNYTRHQQARATEQDPLPRCVVCRKDHNTRQCGSWALRGPQRALQATDKWVCLKCCRAEHAYCPVEQMICGINRCVWHHDPFFHPQTVENIVRARDAPIDSWEELRQNAPSLATLHSAAYQRYGRVRPKKTRRQASTCRRTNGA